MAVWFSSFHLSVFYLSVFLIFYQNLARVFSSGIVFYRQQNFIFLLINVYYNAGNDTESWIEALYLMSTKQLKSCVMLMCWRPAQNALVHAEALPQISPTEMHSGIQRATFSLT